MPKPAAKKTAQKALPSEGADVKKAKKEAAPAVEPEAPKAKKAPAKKAAPKRSPEAAPAPLETVEAEAAPKGKKAPKAKAEPAPETGSEAAAAAAPQAAPAPAPAPLLGLSENAQTILAALQAGRPLEFIFTDGEANPPRTFEPRQLVFDTLAQAWYVWGWDRRYNAERHHRVDALAEVNQVEGVGRSAQGPYKEGTPANLIGGWLGGEPIAVKATLMKQWIFAVKQAPPAFPDFRITDAEDGKATVTFTATDLRAIARWCMQFGDGIQVQEPQRLVDRLKQAGIAWAGKPASTPTAAPAPRAEPRREDHKREDHKRDEPKREGRPERHREDRTEPRRDREREESKPAGKGPKVEIRFERL